MLLLASLGHIFLDRFLQKVDYDSPRGGVSVVIEKAKWTTSHLLIQKATSKDSGIYKCVPLNAMTATINLHVLRGEREGEDIYSLLPPLAHCSTMSHCDKIQYFFIKAYLKAYFSGFFARILLVSLILYEHP